MGSNYANIALEPLIVRLSVEAWFARAIWLMFIQEKAIVPDNTKDRRS
jgi:hypothetical protein